VVVLGDDLARRENVTIRAQTTLLAPRFLIFSGLKVDSDSLTCPPSRHSRAMGAPVALTRVIP